MSATAAFGGDRRPRPAAAGPAAAVPGAVPDAGVVLAGIAAGLPPVGLEDAAELLSRVDRKYLVPAPVMAHLAARLGERFSVLRIGTRRQFRYSSTYFDTPDLLTFRQHRQGRRRRFKIRVRTYLDGGGRWLEVKLNGARGGTDKHRIPYDAGPAGALNAEALDFVSDTLLGKLCVRPPETLRAVLSTDYRRVTLIDGPGEARLTCDTGLVCRDGRRIAAARPDHVLVESKSRNGAALADTILRDLGVRPISVSKYCLGVAMLRRAGANPWHQVLHRYFAAGVQQSPATIVTQWSVANAKSEHHDGS
ncbi:VTC domain-containing protein [Microtetraspora sp. NBRC 13810]|uniref:polyphosphate polymerase domain-containing protein n=1 Tax=Microtetraspora sp. NBRC 13810 TaxID=3030990 RepID=UPI0024A02369|nr:polyphosphate polymerase domain-containing protein [Microtetraspora sp. NBRC 13810]GLW12858.1 VTC domain-containing protein [Microtetraspora sp. NBRC 13810]